MKEDHNQVLLGIGRLEGRMEQFLTHQARHEDRLNAHEKRITALEADDSKQTGFRAGLTAAWAAGSAALGWIAAQAGVLVK